MSSREPNRFVANAAGPRWSYRHRGYALAQALQQLKQQRLASLTTLMVLGIALALPTLLLFVSVTLHSLASRSLEGESLTLYLNPSIDALAGAALADQLRTRADVRETRFISPEQALETLQRESDLGDAVNALGTNPLPAAIVVFPDVDAITRDSTMALTVDALVDEFSTTPSVARVQVDLRWVRRLQAVVELIRVVGGLLGAFLLLTALLVIGNTIRLELLKRQREQEVATLLGASRYFLNRPMLYTGAMYGLLGGLIGILLAIAALLLIRQPAMELANLYDSAFSLPMPSISLMALVLAISTLLGLLGALVALYRPSLHLFPS